MASQRELYWRWVLQPDRNQNRQGVLRSTAEFRSCPYCESRVSIHSPDTVSTLDRPYVGHDSDCKALALALTLDDTGPGSGGGGGSGDTAPFFGSSDPIFGSSDPVFGQV